MVMNAINQNRFRDLSNDELSLVFGGTDTIVVNGYRDTFDWSAYYFYFFDNGYAGGDGSGGGDSGGGGDPVEPPPPADTDVHDVTVKVTGPLTPEQQKGVDDLKAAVARADAAIQAIPDNARIALPDGSVVTGAELKAAWAKTDFEVVDNNYPFANGSGRGEADYNNGDPMVRTTINNLMGYDAHGAAGMNYLVLHEVAHFMQTQRDDLVAANADGSYSEAERHAHEQEANDIAQAIAQTGGLDILTSPGDGYSGSGQSFSVPVDVFDPSSLGSDFWNWYLGGNWQYA